MSDPKNTFTTPILDFPTDQKLSTLRSKALEYIEEVGEDKGQLYV